MAAATAALSGDRTSTRRQATCPIITKHSDDFTLMDALREQVEEIQVHRCTVLVPCPTSAVCAG